MAKTFLNWIWSPRPLKASCGSIDWGRCANLESQWDHLSSHMCHIFVHRKQSDWILLIKMSVFFHVPVSVALQVSFV